MSTTEVEAIISNIIGYKNVTSYGVEVPGAEGRASMISIAEDEVDLVSLYDGVQKKLPSYARPIFVRLISSAEMTGDIKMMIVKT